MLLLTRHGAHPEQWVGIEYGLPGAGKTDGRANYIILLTELINVTKNWSDLDNALLVWKRYVAMARLATDLPVWKNIVWGPPNQSCAMDR